MLPMEQIVELVGGLPSPAREAPAPGPDRHQARGAGAPLAIAGGAYDGAQQYDREMIRWQPPIRSADGDLLADKLVMDARSRDMTRNDAFAANASRIHKDSIVGARFMLSAKPNLDVLGLDDTWEIEFQQEVEAKFSLWAESEDCWPDVNGTRTFTDLVRLGVGVDTIGGEVLATVEWIRDRDPRRIWNTAINFIDCDRLSNPQGRFNSKTLRNGVETDPFGRPLAYNIRRGHPGDVWQQVDSWTWDRVLATKPWGRKQVIHLYEHLRPDQSRGVSMMTSALKEMRMTHKFRDITLQNAVVNATYAATIESELPSEAVFAQLGMGSTNLGDAAGIYGNAFLNSVMKYVGQKTNSLQLDGAKIPHLFPGTKLQMRPASDPGGVGSDFEDSLLRYIAASVGIGYEEFSNNYSNTNYSSIQAASQAIRRGMVARKRRTADRMGNVIYKLWLEEGISKGEITSMPRNAPVFQEGLFGDAYACAEWIGADVGQVDQLKETQASMLRIENGLSTYARELAGQGLDYRYAFKQMAREKALLKELDLWDDIREGAVRTTNTKNALQAGAATDSAGDGQPTKKKKAA